MKLFDYSIVFFYLLLSVGVLWFYYLLFMPFSVLIVDDIDAYKPSYIDKFRYLVVLEQPFKVVENPTAGETVLFRVAFVYYFGEPPEWNSILRCDDDHLYIVRQTSNMTPKPIGPVATVSAGISDYNIIPTEARGKTCRVEFQTRWPMMFRESIQKVIVTEYFEVL